MTPRPRSFISLYPADRKPVRPNMRRHPIDMHDLQAQLRGDVDEKPHDWSTSWWVPVLFLLGLIGLVALVLHFAEWID